MAFAFKTAVPFAYIVVAPVVPAVVVAVPVVVVPAVVPVVAPFMVPLLPVDMPAVVVAAPASDIVEVPSDGIVDMVVSAFIPVSEFIVGLESIAPPAVVEVSVEVESLPQLESDRVAAVRAAAAKKNVRFMEREFLVKE